MLCWAQMWSLDQGRAAEPSLGLVHIFFLYGRILSLTLAGPN